MACENSETYLSEFQTTLVEFVSVLLFYVCFSFGIGCICCIDIESLIQIAKLLYATVFVVVIHRRSHLIMRQPVLA
jgi:hypothetical protein